MKQLLTAVAMLVALGGPAVAHQSTCGTHASMIASLDLKYGESRHGAGMGASNLFELWASAETGTWTFLEVFPSGMACVRALGEDWAVGPPVVPGNPA